MDKQDILVQKYDNNVNILDLYPEYKIKGSHTSYSPMIDNQMKLFHLFPFFKHIIVDIIPFNNQKIFEENYGMGVNDLLELNMKGKILFRLPFVPQYYYGLENNYLDEIICLNPPCSILSNYSHGLLVNHNDENQLKELNNLFNTELKFFNPYLLDRGEFDPLSIFAVNMVHNYSNKLENYPDTYYSETNKEYLRKLWSCGFNNIVDNLKEFLNKDKNRLDLSLLYSGLYSKFLSDPILESLDGTHLLNYRLKYISNELNFRRSSGIFNDNGYLRQLSFNNSDILNSELIKVVNEKVEFPLLDSLESYDDIKYNGAKDALFSLEKEISKKNPNNITEYINLLNDELLEAKETIQSFNNSNNNKLKKIMGCIGLIGNIGSLISPTEYKSYFDLIGLGSNVIKEGINTNKFQQILKRISKFRKPNHVIFFLDNKETIFIKDMNKDKTNYTPIEDNLNKKYVYYEYLLDKIPSLKEFIAISSKEYINSQFEISLDKNKKFTNNLINDIQKYIKPELLKKQYKSQLIYGISYQVNNHNYITNDITIDIINPKYIRPVIIDGNIQFYKMIKRGNEIKISSKNVTVNKGFSFIENNINYLDMMYPKITNKDTRPKLKWDLYQIEEEKLKTASLEESLKILEELHKKSNEFKKNYYLQSKVLIQIGDLYYNCENIKKANKYYKESLKILSNCKSSELKIIEENLKNKLDKNDK